jgi:hypothetical protein
MWQEEPLKGDGIGMKKKYTVIHKRMVQEVTYWEIEAESEEIALDRFIYEGKCTDLGMEFEGLEDGTSVIIDVEEIKNE